MKKGGNRSALYQVTAFQMLKENFTSTVSPLGRCTCPQESCNSSLLLFYKHTNQGWPFPWAPVTWKTHTLFICSFFIFNPLLFVIGFLLSLFWVLLVTSLSSFGTLDCHTSNFPPLVSGLSFYILFISLLWELPVQTMPVSLNYLAFSHFFFFFYSSLRVIYSYTVRITFSKLLTFLNCFHLPESHTMELHLSVSEHYNIYSLKVILLFLAITWSLSSKEPVTSTCQ